MSVEEVSLYFLGGVPIQYFGLDPIDPRSSCSLFMGYRQQSAPIIISQCCSAVIVKVKIIITSDCFTGP